MFGLSIPGATLWYENIVCCQLYSSLAVCLLYNMDYLLVTLRILRPIILLQKGSSCCKWHSLSFVIFNFKFVPESAKETVISSRFMSVFNDTFLIVEILGSSSNTQYPYSCQDRVVISLLIPLIYSNLI